MGFEILEGVVNKGVDKYIKRKELYDVKGSINGFYYSAYRNFF
jgi:hypothetical protein